MNIVVIGRLMGEATLDEIDIGSRFLLTLNDVLTQDDEPFTGQMTGLELITHYKSLSVNTRYSVENLSLCTREEWRPIQNQIDFILFTKQVKEDKEGSLLKMIYSLIILLMFIIVGVGIGGYHVLLHQHNEVVNSFVIEFLGKLFEALMSSSTAGATP